MYFIENKYYNWYNKIIDNALKRNVFQNKYFEKHHIIPKSLGGTNKKENLVTLSAREHYVSHWLLTKFTNGINKRRMSFAFLRMNTSKNKNQNRYSNSRGYQFSKNFLIEMNKKNIKEILEDDITKLLSKNSNLTEEQLAKSLNVGTNTLRRRIKSFGYKNIKDLRLKKIGKKYYSSTYLDVTEKEILKILKENPNLMEKDLSKILKISRTTIQRKWKFFDYKGFNDFKKQNEL
jgi:predicted transcriptional regulator